MCSGKQLGMIQKAADVRDTHEIRKTGPVRGLYMEDDPGIARLFQKRLAPVGYLVVLAADGLDGLQKYQAGRYDVVVVDYKMPGYDGLQVIQKLTATGDAPPMIMLTGGGSEILAVEAMKLGASDYLVKDLDGGYLELLPSVIE